MLWIGLTLVFIVAGCIRRWCMMLLIVAAALDHWPRRRCHRASRTDDSTHALSFHVAGRVFVGDDEGAETVYAHRVVMRVLVDEWARKGAPLVVASVLL